MLSTTTINFRLGTRLRGCWITKQESGLPSEFLTIMVMKNASMLTFVRIVKSITNLRCFKAFKTILGRISHSLFFLFHIPHPRTDSIRATLPNFPLLQVRAHSSQRRNNHLASHCHDLRRLES